MTVDARSLPENATIETDVCIIGAGVAGLTLAREFIGSGFRVCLLECGGPGPDRATQSLFWGENKGHPYFPLDVSHSCGFGGTTNHWTIRLGDNRLGVRLRPLDRIDFEEREWIPYSGWPFQKSHLDPYYDRAQSICQVGSSTYDLQDWEDPRTTPRLPFVSSRVQTAIFHFTSRDIFIKDYREAINKADNITTYLYANALELETDESAQTVTRLRAGCLQGKKFWVSAKQFVLALGAIETARLLLLSDKSHRCGLGNENDLVGRFFMEHPHIWTGRFFSPATGIIDATALYRMHTANTRLIMGKLTLNEEVLRREKLLNYCVSLHEEPVPKRRNAVPSWGLVSWPLLSPHNGRSAAKHMGSAPRGIPPVKERGSAALTRDRLYNRGNGLGRVISGFDDAAISAYRKTRSRLGSVVNRFRSSKKITVFQLNHMTEQSPNPDSRVTLDDERDMLGRRRICLNWQLNPLDIRSIIRAQEIIDEELRNAGLGWLRIDLKDETPPPHLEGGWHHMGTTRMHRDPKKGVVNEHCRVHSTTNVFIAGPSVFPTGGYANPVLTIIALTARLADHVKGLME